MQQKYAGEKRVSRYPDDFQITKTSLPILKVVAKRRKNAISRNFSFLWKKLRRQELKTWTENNLNFKLIHQSKNYSHNIEIIIKLRVNLDLCSIESVFIILRKGFVTGRLAVWVYSTRYFSALQSTRKCSKFQREKKIIKNKIEKVAFA